MKKNSAAPLSGRLYGTAIIVALLLVACSDERAAAPQKTGEPQPSTATGCRACHQVKLDPAHELDCTTCHDGSMQAATRQEAHAGLTARPAHPVNMLAKCGPCHQRQVEEAAKSLHFTLANELNLVRAAFGAGQRLPDLSAIPAPEKIATILDLADDLLRHRCLRCHPYSTGDTYSATVRGTGCASCHLRYVDRTLQSHSFAETPADAQCLACHYGNFVGADFHGRFEHDFSQEFRTPYRNDPLESRPYGVEYHQLTPDLHQQAGMVCIDCHPGRQLMGAPHFNAVSCAGCHLLGPDDALPLAFIRRENNRLEITTASGTVLVIPPAKHPAHRDTAGTDCMVCHARWTYTDQGTHLLRHDRENHADWSLLTVQGSFAVEDRLNLTLTGRVAPAVPAMPDTITGLSRPGLWFLGYEQRRWENPLIGTDATGRRRIFRPLLDLHLSYTDQDGRVIFDAVTADRTARLLPYTPHTVGKAGAFYRLRLRDNLSTYYNDQTVRP